MYVIILKLHKKASVREIINIINDLGCLWSVKESEVIVISEDDVNEIKASLLTLRASQNNFLINDLIVLNPENNVAKILIKNMELSTKVSKLIKMKWESLRDVYVESETPLIINKDFNLLNLIRNPSNEILSLNNLILKKLIIKRHCKKCCEFTWKATYKLRFKEAIYLKIIGILGIGLRTFEGYGRFKLINV